MWYFKRWALQCGIALTKTAGHDPKATWSSRSGSSVAEDPTEENMEASSGWI